MTSGGHTAILQYVYLILLFIPTHPLSYRKGPAWMDLWAAFKSSLFLKQNFNSSIINLLLGTNKYSREFGLQLFCQDSCHEADNISQQMAGNKASGSTHPEILQMGKKPAEQHTDCIHPCTEEIIYTNNPIQQRCLRKHRRINM